MRIRHGLVLTAVALALAVPSAAHAQGAGDDQYTDPFSGQSTPTATPQATATPAPPPVAPAQSRTTAAPAATAAPAPAQASTAAAGPSLPYTGLDAWIPGLSGALLLGAGVALRVRLRD